MKVKMKLLPLAAATSLIFYVVSEADIGTDSLNKLRQTYQNMSDMTFRGVQEFTVAETNCQVAVPFEFGWSVRSTPTVHYASPQIKRECFASISKAGGFDLPSTWADAKLVGVGVVSVTVLPEQELDLNGETVHCNVLEVVYDDYYARIRRTTNPVRYWIDVGTGLLRRITFSEVLAQGTRDWTVTVERATRLASLTPPTQQNTTNTSPLVGKEAPDFALAANDGSHFQLSALRGKTVVLNFWATWCGPCLEEIPDLEKLQRNASNRTIILGISDDDEPTVREWERKYGRSFRTLVGARGTFEAYGVKPLPTLVVINKQGIVTEFTVGFHLLNELEKITATH